MSSAITWNPFVALAPAEKATEPAKVEAEGTTKAETKLPVTYKKVSHNVHIGDEVEFNADNKDSGKPMEVTIEVTYPKASKKNPAAFPQTVIITETVPPGTEKPITAVEKVQKELKNRGIHGKVQAHVKVTATRNGEAPQTTERDVNLKRRSDDYDFPMIEIPRLESNPSSTRRNIFSNSAYEFFIHSAGGAVIRKKGV